MGKAKAKTATIDGQDKQEAKEEDGPWSGQVKVSVYVCVYVCVSLSSH